MMHLCLRTIAREEAQATKYKKLKIEASGLTDLIKNVYQGLIGSWGDVGKDGEAEQPPESW